MFTEWVTAPSRIRASLRIDAASGVPTSNGVP
jgi:hypothetical protein